MPLGLPDYSNEFLDAFSVCARIEEGANPLPESETAFESKVGEGDNSFWLRTITNAQKKPHGVHLHMDSLRESRFRKVPEESSPLSETVSLFDEYFGREVFAKPRASFAVPLDDLPTHNPAAVLLRVSTGEGDNSIRLTGATFEIGKGDSFRIEWAAKTRSEQEFAIATISTDVTTSMGESFLTELLEKLTGVFRAFMTSPQTED